MPPETEQDSDQTRSVPEGLPALREFLQVRWKLLSLEAKEASQALTARLVAIVAAVFAAVFAWALLLLAVWWSLSYVCVHLLPMEQAHWAAPAAAGILFLLHLVAALLLIRFVRKKPSPPLFECTREEWKKDQAWLHKENSSDKNAN